MDFYLTESYAERSNILDEHITRFLQNNPPNTVGESKEQSKCCKKFYYEID
jgi:hypothetical protein